MKVAVKEVGKQFRIEEIEERNPLNYCSKVMRCDIVDCVPISERPSGQRLAMCVVKDGEDKGLQTNFLVPIKEMQGTSAKTIAKKIVGTVVFCRFKLIKGSDNTVKDFQLIDLTEQDNLYISCLLSTEEQIKLKELEMDKVVRKKCTLNSNISFDELHHDYLGLEQEIRKYDFSNLTRQQMEDMARYCEEKTFITDMYNAYECAVTTAWEIEPDENAPTRIIGLLDAKNYADITSTLCNKNFVIAREIGYLALTDNDLKWDSNDVVNDTVDQHIRIFNSSPELLHHFTQFKADNEVITVGMIKNAINAVDNIKEQLGLDLDKKSDRIRMAEIVISQINSENIKSYAVADSIIRKDLEKINKNNLQVVESNDDAVMTENELYNTTSKGTDVERENDDDGKRGGFKKIWSVVCSRKKC